LWHVEPTLSNIVQLIAQGGETTVRITVLQCVVRTCLQGHKEFACVVCNHTSGVNSCKRR